MPKRARPSSLSLAVLGAALLVPGLVPSSGCAVPRRVEPLGDAVRTFNEAVRWERFEMAAVRLPPTQRDDFLDLRDRLSEELRISGYEVVRARHDKTGRRAKVHIKYTWHLDSRGVVHTTHTVQRWERPRSDWVLLAEHHLRGEPMPGVAPALASGDDASDDPKNPDADPASGDLTLRETPR